MEKLYNIMTSTPLYGIGMFVILSWFFWLTLHIKNCPTVLLVVVRLFQTLFCTCAIGFTFLVMDIIYQHGASLGCKSLEETVTKFKEKPESFTPTYNPKETALPIN
jgi:hypothetical protein